MKKKKLGIVGVLSNPAKRDTSHNGGWTYVLKAVTEHWGRDVSVMTEKDDWNQCDELLVNEGVNYKEGVYNLFGGVSTSLLQRLKQLNEFRGEIFCLGEYIDYRDLCKKRDIYFEFTKQITYLDSKYLGNKLVYGDSHAISVFRPGFAISRNDGATLHGMLEKGLRRLIPSGLNELTFYAGNIDVRHHLCRHWQNTKATDEDTRTFLEPMLDDLEKQLNELKIDKINLVCLLPIENESRKIPGTGMYKGTPFYGAWWERDELVKAFNEILKEICERNNWTLLTWPDEFINEKGELIFDVMEARQSVHLAPKSYMFADELLYRKQLNLFE